MDDPDGHAAYLIDRLPRGEGVQSELARDWYTHGLGSIDAATDLPTIAEKQGNDPTDLICERVRRFRLWLENLPNMFGGERPIRAAVVSHQNFMFKQVLGLEGMSYLGSTTRLIRPGFNWECADGPASVPAQSAGTGWIKKKHATPAMTGHVKLANADGHSKTLVRGRPNGHKDGNTVAKLREGMMLAATGETEVNKHGEWIEVSWSALPKQAPMPKAPADVQAPPADAQQTVSGLVTSMIKAGDGKAKPGPTSIVTVHYTGWTTDGEAFDSSVARRRPTTLAINKFIAGWTEALQLMSVGEERRLWIPQDLAYRGRAGRPAGMLVFDVQLLEFCPST